MSKSKKKLDQLNEIGQRKKNERRGNKPEAKDSVKPAKERRKVSRRRQIDPTTCEREYTEQEVEFMRAMDDYKRTSGRMFPTCSEILEVLAKIGYRQIAECQSAEYTPSETSDQSV